MRAGRVASVAWLLDAAPGIGLAVGLAAIAKLISASVGVSSVIGIRSGALSPVLLAVVVGLLWRNTVGVSARFEDGLHWVMNTLLKAGIVLVGLRLTVGDATNIAAIGIPVVLGCLCVAFVGGVVIARLLSIPSRLAALIVTGTAVCGCTAVIALSPVIRARSEETAFALAIVVVIGCTGMLFDPWVAARLFAASATQAGVFLGTAIHDTSQVVGAALIYSQQHAAPETLAAASFTKLLRNLSIAVIIPVAAWLMRDRATASELAVERGSPLPWFVVCFVLLIALRSAGDSYFGVTGAGSVAWHGIVTAGQTVSELFLISGMTAIGLSVSIAQIRGIGWRPLVAGLLLAVIVTACSITLTTIVPRLQE